MILSFPLHLILSTKIMVGINRMLYLTAPLAVSLGTINLIKGEFTTYYKIYAFLWLLLERISLISIAYGSGGFDFSSCQLPRQHTLHNQALRR